MDDSTENLKHKISDLQEIIEFLEGYRYMDLMSIGPAIDLLTKEMNILIEESNQPPSSKEGLLKYFLSMHVGPMSAIIDSLLQLKPNSDETIELIDMGSFSVKHVKIEEALCEAELVIYSRKWDCHLLIEFFYPSYSSREYQQYRVDHVCLVEPKVVTKTEYLPIN